MDEGGELTVPTKICILVVDSDRSSLAATSLTLSALKHHVVTAVNAKDALSIVHTQKRMVHLVLTDINLPDTDGFKFIQLIGKEYKLPVVMALDTYDDVTLWRAFSNGAIYCFAKPITLFDAKDIWKFVLIKTIDRSPASQAPVDPTGKPWADNLNSEPQEYRKRKAEQLCECQNKDREGSKKMKNFSCKLHIQLFQIIKQLISSYSSLLEILTFMDVPGLEKESISSLLQRYKMYMKSGQPPLYNTDAFEDSSSSSNYSSSKQEGFLQSQLPMSMTGIDPPSQAGRSMGLFSAMNCGMDTLESDSQPVYPSKEFYLSKNAFQLQNPLSLTGTFQERFACLRRQSQCYATGQSSLFQDHSLASAMNSFASSKFIGIPSTAAVNRMQGPRYSMIADTSRFENNLMMSWESTNLCSLELKRACNDGSRVQFEPMETPIREPMSSYNRLVDCSRMTSLTPIKEPMSSYDRLGKSNCLQSLQTENTSRPALPPHGQLSRSYEQHDTHFEQYFSPPGSLQDLDFLPSPLQPCFSTPSLHDSQELTQKSQALPSECASSASQGAETPVIALVQGSEKNKEISSPPSGSAEVVSKMPSSVQREDDEEMHHLPPSEQEQQVREERISQSATELVTHVSSAPELEGVLLWPPSPVTKQMLMSQAVGQSSIFYGDNVQLNDTLVEPHQLIVE